MTKVSDQFAAFNRSQLEAALRIAEAAAEHMEKMAEVQFTAARAAYADGVKALRQLASIKDVSELPSVSSEMAQPAWEKANNYVTSVYGVVSSAQSKFAEALEAQVAELNRKSAAALGEAIKAAPPGAEAALSAIKASLSSTNAMYESMVKAAKQMAGIAQANITAATKSAGSKK